MKIEAPLAGLLVGLQIQACYDNLAGWEGGGELATKLPTLMS